MTERDEIRKLAHVTAKGTETRKIFEAFGVSIASMTRKRIAAEIRGRAVVHRQNGVVTLAHAYAVLADAVEGE